MLIKNRHTQFQLTLPEWLGQYIQDQDPIMPDMEKRMQFVISLARLNIEHNSGGPFGAAVFDMSANRLIAAGVNLVVTGNSSVWHAEIVAMILAQQAIGHFNFKKQDAPACELVTSTEPCAMCMGAIPWAGITQLVCGARDKDARGIGFDEGAKVKHWQKALRKRNITVIRDVCRDQAVQVLELYNQHNGMIYNG
ncbi:MAG TPA: nucleoside deaminase [bacterium]|nr:nucleoside deaminase [bacterium]HPN42503.1 nucleoside deaminase [bacterium]